MKKIIFFLFFIGLFANAQIVNIPDANFKAALLSASPSNWIASTEIPVYNINNDTWSVSVYNNVDTNNDGEIQVIEAQVIKFLDIKASYISDLTGLESFSNLIYLNSSYNQLQSINVLPSANFQGLDCSYNQLTSLNVTNVTNLQYLDCKANQLTSLNVLGLTHLQVLYCSSNQLQSLDFLGLTQLRKLYFSYNQLTSIDVSGLINLQRLSCNSNQLSSLNILSLTNLQFLDCSVNQLSSLEVSGLTNLGYLECRGNQITNLNLNGLTNLQRLFCSDNQLQSLNVSGLINLLIIECYNNQITSIDLSGTIQLASLYCINNQLTSLDISSLPNMRYLTCYSNQLETLNIKNGNNCWCNTLYSESSLEFSNNPNLQYICTDEMNFSIVQQKITNYGYTNCHVNSYCSFSPGGTFYNINGTNRYDENNNGCDIGDILYPNLKLNITNGTVTGSVIGNTTGSYAIPVQAGTHTLTPQLENPSYFTISPSTTTVTFPTQPSPFTQDYCITANGTHHDLEVVIFPVNIARPGFDAAYKITYKNKGTNTENATLNFHFDDAVLDFVSASTTATTQNVGNLVWNLGALAPFQSGEIIVTLNLNAPTETPELNSGDVLNYSATINGAFADETPTDNVFDMPQVVVNSYDPNDKTCLNGTTISTDNIGEYIYYMIRFENTGTFPAQNIVVKDIIDIAKFDVNSLQMVNASHNCYTKITGNKVEFIFENINLPFDDATNDGYVVFKIKTLPTLTTNSVIENTADIFFDYNFPITTNTASSIFSNLETAGFDVTKVSVSPNPASNSVVVKSASKINSITIFDIQGRQIQTKLIDGFETSIDVSHLQLGNYLLKISTENGVINHKIIKQ